MTEERVGYKVKGRAEVRRETRLPFGSRRYKPPTKEEIREVIRVTGMTGAQVALYVGVEGDHAAGSRTVRKWTGGERSMPYSVWRLLLIRAELALEDPDVELELEPRERAVAERK